MASNINPTNIDITYPVAGQDNDTKGFRDNFTIIKNNFSVASREITAIQTLVDNTPSIIPAGPISTTFNNEASTAAGTAGQVGFDSNYWYFCFATNNWARCPTSAGITTMLSTFTGNISAGNITSNTLTLTSAIQFANLTTAEIATISPTERGMTVYNYNTGNVQVYNGTKWANVTLS